MTKFHCLIAFTSRDLGNTCITIVCLPGYDFMKFDTNLILLIKLSRNMTRKSGEILKYLENEKSF